jgi:hypothetical protein
LVCRAATALPWAAALPSFSFGIFWIDQAQAFIKHLLKLYFEILA